MQERKRPDRSGIALRGKKIDVAKVHRNRSAPAVSAAMKGASGPQPLACPECGKAFRTDEAVQTHRHAAHGTAAMVVGDMTRCAECGSLVKNSQMERHRRRIHGIV
ncbi:MAG: hypothetical protein ABSH20_00120 [Tepidisphaeraceae bacterium]|jgi:uncharacterized C2H2 Zn-finger protein